MEGVGGSWVGDDPCSMCGEEFRRAAGPVGRVSEQMVVVGDEHGPSGQGGEGMAQITLPQAERQEFRQAVAAAEGGGDLGWMTGRQDEHEPYVTQRSQPQWHG